MVSTSLNSSQSLESSNFFSTLTSYFNSFSEGNSPGEEARGSFSFEWDGSTRALGLLTAIGGGVFCEITSKLELLRTPKTCSRPQGSWAAVGLSMIVTGVYAVLAPQDFNSSTEGWLRSAGFVILGLALTEKFSWFSIPIILGGTLLARGF